MKNDVNSRIETKEEVCSYIQNMKYALQHGAKIQFQAHRRVDDTRPEKYTNMYTINMLFPDEDPIYALKRELMSLTDQNYIKTVKDIRFPKRSEMREFGKTYNGTDDIYIKIRVELLGEYGNTIAFVMSFHFAEKEFTKEDFPYKNN